MAVECKNCPDRVWGERHISNLNNTKIIAQDVRPCGNCPTPEVKVEIIATLEPERLEIVRKLFPNL